MGLGLDGIKDHYNGLSDTFGFTVLPPQSVLIDYGFDLLENGDSASAMQVLNYNIGLRPDSSFGHYILGIAHYRLEDVPAAAEELEIALKLDPENQRIKSVLQRIQNELKETGEEQH
jgi:tetratricopeptide (TPR) repeat protein